MSWLLAIDSPIPLTRYFLLAALNIYVANTGSRQQTIDQAQCDAPQHEKAALVAADVGAGRFLLLRYLRYLIRDA
jgi:hypothetical protein